MPVRVLKQMAGLVAAGLGLAGCATTQGPPAPSAPPPVAAAEPEGYFKIGTPYQVDGKWYYPAEDYAYVQEGIASWYGQDFHGKKTANGEKYDMNAITAAHPTLPMPSVVRVTNLDNGRQLNVRVNDRGPFHSSRIIDLSRRAAQLLGFYEVGTAHVRVEIDATESLNLKNLTLKDHPPEMPRVVAAPREAITSVALAPVTATAAVVAPKAPPAAKQPPAPTSKQSNSK
ncbi:MAG: septal ring lytic transglycosylase RlpA family protein, partial [Rhodospirillaceae bacterium]|nr:septal ring lytic transglycosylase RlpA family protein [Rhodospirillaceae bacterium]